MSDIDIEKTVFLGELFELYGNLLGKVQQAVMCDYYENDLTLSEIAELKEMTRQSVYSAVMKAQKRLLEIEEKVGAYKQISKLKKKTITTDPKKMRIIVKRTIIK